MSELICPKCQQPLTPEGNQWRCPDRHSYDTARQGYINLLLVNQKKSKNPGDDAEMVISRTDFLNTGAYQPVSDALNTFVGTAENRQILDIGCGEGYYTERLNQHLSGNSNITGLDISREAVKGACRRSKDIRWLVASGARPPVKEHSIDTIITLFTPLMPEGLDHALTDEGDIITAVTGERHLYELRAEIYDEVRLEGYSPVTAMEKAGFQYVEETRINYRTTVEGGDTLLALLNMTPHRWKVRPERVEKLRQLDSLNTEIDVLLHRFRRSERTD